MKTVFVSQPMNGRTTNEIQEERDRILTKLWEKYGPINVLDTLFTHRIGTGLPLEYLGESIKYLSQADLAVFAPNWESARGCRVERLCCEEYGVKIIDFKEGAHEEPLRQR